ncbi:Methionyl-tRNA formyltransferase, mitochondrial [Temnothorax longispinosus]|uniref:methionyl-tRNA formyltransferase n=1 Tax=Temnothorax longispinosus TaxID=300112 RepID=A0A4S2KU65_9HYME|nr:Methionyl-tRNA formyltransferase, mitochondrial [Temnothorax longispinosus]
MLNAVFLTRVTKIHLFLYETFKRSDKSREITFSCGVHHVRKRQSHSFKAGSPWSVLFFGQDECSMESLRGLYNEYKAERLCRLEVATVPTRKRNFVRQFAEEKGLVINEWPLATNPQGFHIGIVVCFGHLIPLSIINSFPFGILNIHFSLLPRWRGASPDIYALMNGDTQTGITIMKVAEKFDTGDIVAQEKIDIHADETRPELNMKLAKLGANVLIDVIRKLPQVLSSSRPQGKVGITYAPKITSKIAVVKWDEMTAKNVYDLHRALLGSYSLKTKFDGTGIKLLDVRQTSISSTGVKNADVPDKMCVINVKPLPGFAKFDWKSKQLIVTCKGPSWISVTKVIVEKCSVMSAQAFANGFILGRKKDGILFQSNIT